VRDILVRARVMYAEDERGAQAEALLLKLQRIVEGKEGATLVLEDPHGTSAILSEQASREKLSPDEAALLRTGVIMLDARDVESN
jgi:C4-type Zn-finger protein